MICVFSKFQRIFYSITLWQLETLIDSKLYDRYLADC